MAAREDAPNDSVMIETSTPGSASASSQKGLLGLVSRANELLPGVVILSTLLALAYPPSFTWFTTRYYAPALGFLMFAVGINLSLNDFHLALRTPGPIVLAYLAQFAVKPALGCFLAASLIPCLGLPAAVGSGLILTACVSGAQLSNYATFLVDPKYAPLSIVLTALSTLSAVLLTPSLTLLLLHKSLPVDAVGMVNSITQIVLLPISAGLLLNRYAPSAASALKPFLPAMAVFTTALCVGSPLAINSAAVRSTLGVSLLFPVVLFHAAAFAAGYRLSDLFFPNEAPLARTIAFETGMQSSLLGLALANRFFHDPLVALPSAISVVVMSLMGFGMVVHWKRRGQFTTL